MPFASVIGIGLFAPTRASDTGPISSLEKSRVVLNYTQVHYVGTWNLANEIQPEFLDEKYQLDPAIQDYFPQFNFKEAVMSLPH